MLPRLYAIKLVLSAARQQVQLGGGQERGVFPQLLLDIWP